MTDLTRILGEIREGDAGAPERLAAALYDELRRMAGRQMAHERPDHTLQPTALVHEAYVRLVSGEVATFENRAHFLGAAAIAIRRVLVEHARKRARIKRGGDLQRVDLDDVDPAGPVPDAALIGLDEALVELAGFAPRQARLVELKFFAGMSIPEIARLMQVSESTIQREWRIARAWLKGELEDRDGS